MLLTDGEIYIIPDEKLPCYLADDPISTDLIVAGIPKQEEPIGCQSR